MSRGYPDGMSYSRSLLHATRSLMELTLETRDHDRLEHIKKVMRELKWLLDEANLASPLGEDLIDLVDLAKASAGAAKQK